MEHSFLSWTRDTKLLQHHVTDLFTSVHVTKDLSAGASFGPCVLQNVFYDTVAFIALKSRDERNKSYVFRVDAEAAKSSPSALSWLRLVQAASNRQEQNMEAYLRSGQLHFRSTRNIQKDEELLVWYDEELSRLLGFSEIKSITLTSGFKCTKCDAAFENEHPYLAHCRFLCARVKDEAHRSGSHERKMEEIRRPQTVTDFHNIARDLERKKTDVSAEDKGLEDSKSQKPVLLEKTNISNDVNITQAKGEGHTVLELAASVMRHNADKYLFKDELPEWKRSAFTEVRKVRERLKRDKAMGTDDERGANQTGQGSSLQSDGSAFSFVSPKGAQEEQKSAFRKPSKRTVNDSTAHPSRALSDPPERSEDGADAITSKSVLGYATLSGGWDWRRHIGLRVRASSPLTPQLPPTYITSFGVSAQNWCAKCNLSFRMTSDLVSHMRSHHKKEFGIESQAKRRREEKLACPICREYFRERHHLSRHMTSHN